MMIWFYSLMFVWLFANGFTAFLLGWIGLKQSHRGALVAFGCATFIFLQFGLYLLLGLHGLDPFLPEEVLSALIDLLSSPFFQLCVAVASAGFGIGFLLFALSLKRRPTADTPAPPSTD